MFTVSNRLGSATYPAIARDYKTRGATTAYLRRAFGLSLEAARNLVTEARDCGDAETELLAWAGTGWETPERISVCYRDDNARWETDPERFRDPAYGFTAPTLHGTFSLEPGEPAFIWEPEAAIRTCDCGVSNLYTADGSPVEPVNACQCSASVVDERIETARGTIRVLGPEAPIYDAYDWEATPTGRRSNSTESIHGSAPTLPEAVEAGFTALWQHDGLRASVEPEPEPTPEAVMTAVKCSELNTEWLNTRRGLVGLSRVETPRPAGLSPFVSWIWFTETGDTGVVDGADARAMAITEAYVSMVRAASPAPVAFPWER